MRLHAACQIHGVAPEIINKLSTSNRCTRRWTSPRVMLHVLLFQVAPRHPQSPRTVERSANLTARCRWPAFPNHRSRVDGRTPDVEVRAQRHDRQRGLRLFRVMDSNRTTTDEPGHQTADQRTAQSTTVRRTPTDGTSKLQFSCSASCYRSTVAAALPGCPRSPISNITDQISPETAVSQYAGERRARETVPRIHAAAPLRLAIHQS